MRSTTDVLLANHAALAASAGSLAPPVGPQPATTYGLLPTGPRADYSTLPGAWDGRSLGLLGQVQTPLNLILPLKSPAQAPALGRFLQENLHRFHEGVLGLRYVHFARFIIPPDGASLMVMTSFDGDFDSYLMDFVATMADLFTGVMFFVKDAPPLPVEKYPHEFRTFIAQHNVAHQGVVPAYPGMTVLEILRAGGMRGNELTPTAPRPLPQPSPEATA